MANGSKRWLEVLGSVFLTSFAASYGVSADSSARYQVKEERATDQASPVADLERGIAPVASGPEAVTVRFRLLRKYVVLIRGSIGKLGGLNMILDTGSVPSVVSQRVARELSLDGTTEQLSVFSQEIDALKVILPSVKIGPVQALQIPALARDLSAIEQGIGMQIDALIGLDVLGLASFTIDYKSKEILFSPTDPSTPAVQVTSDFPPLVVDAVADGRPMRLMVDTGANDIILFRRRVQDRFGTSDGGVKGSRNIAGEARLRKLQLKAFRLGSTEFGSRTALILETGDSKLPDFDGLLGVASLRLRSIRFDATLRIVTWQK